MIDMPPKATNGANTKARKTSAAKAAPTKKTTTATTAKESNGAKAAASNKTTTKAREPLVNSNGPAKKIATSPNSKSKQAPASESIPTTNGEPHINGIKTETVSSKKRKAESEEPTSVAPAKKAKSTGEKKPAAKKPAAKKPKVVLNHAPEQKLNVYMFGQGENAELGLGVGKNVSNVKRPRLNPLLPADKVGIVEIACGGMHTAALSYENKIYTWGVNDQGALGRDTAWDGGLKDMDDNDSDDSDSDPGEDLNPHEATPTAIDTSHFPEGTVITQLAAGDSSTWALTDDGFVYGWGTFRGNEGIMGFTGDCLVQKTPMLIPGLKKIVKLACGENHVLALDNKGAVFAWGSGQQNQLGRRIVERTKANGLVPREFGLPKGIVDIAAGNNHSFAIHKSGKVYTWGLNSFGETGISENAGEDEAAILHPTVIPALTGKDITCMSGGSHHSIAVTADGQCLVWGRLDGYQCGIKLDSLPKDVVIVDSRGHPRILKQPTAVPGINAQFAAAGSDHCVVITKEGKAYSWGFSAVYQTGLGTEDDVEVATLIDNTAVRDKKLTWAGAGGQFSIVAGPADTPMVNGVH